MKKSMHLTESIIIFLFLISSNSFAQWQLVSTINVSSALKSISVADPANIWICGGFVTPVIYRSNSSGLNFVSVPTAGIPYDLFCIWGKDANVCFVGDGGTAGGNGGNAKVFQTTNAGTTWSMILSTGGTTGFINGIVFSRTLPQVGVVESDPPNGYGTDYWWQRTTDGGSTWSQINGPALGTSFASAINSLVCIDASWFGIGTSTASGNSRIIFTTDGGSNFGYTAPLPVSGSYCSAFAMNTDKMKGLAATITSLPNVAVTTNGCSTFSSVNTGGGVTGLATAKWVPGTDFVYVMGVTGSNGACKKSTDAGVTWTTMTTAGITSIIHMDLVYSGGTIYAFAIDPTGHVIRLIENPIGIHPIGNNIPAEYRLEQNYPNPFNPATKIYFALPKASNVTLKVYDLLGHEVKTLVNENKPAGIYSVDFDASSLSSGVYFYTIQAGDFTASKKMTVIK